MNLFQAVNNFNFALSFHKNIQIGSVNNFTNIETYMIKIISNLHHISNSVFEQLVGDFFARCAGK